MPINNKAVKQMYLEQSNYLNPSATEEISGDLRLNLRPFAQFASKCTSFSSLARQGEMSAIDQHQAVVLS